MLVLEGFEESVSCETDTFVHNLFSIAFFWPAGCMFVAPQDGEAHAGGEGEDELDTLQARTPFRCRRVGRSRDCFRSYCKIAILGSNVMVLKSRMMLAVTPQGAVFCFCDGGPLRAGHDWRA